MKFKYNLRRRNRW